MKKLLIVLLSALSLTAFAQQKKVAVYVTGEQSGITKVLGDQLVAAFAKSGKYTAIERTTSFLAELGKEQNYQRTGAVSDSEIARLGVQFGVNYVCVADVSEVFGEKYITARLINVETAEIVNTHNVSGEMNSMNSCLRMAGEIAENLSKGTFAEQAEENRIKEEAKRKQAEEEVRKAKLRAQGLVDLGLPSGTLWRNKNEAGYYTYYQAVSNFGNNLPSMEQWTELRNSCLWTWTGSGYKVEGSNGEYIYLPAESFIAVVAEETTPSTIYANSGNYWTSTRIRSDSYEKYVAFDQRGFSTRFDIPLINKLSVRLVK